MLAFLYAQCGMCSHVFRMSISACPVCACLQCYVFDSSVSLDHAGPFALGLQHCPELEQDAEYFGIPLLFLSEKGDGLILPIDFSLQSSSVSGPIGGPVKENWPLGSL